MNKREVFDKVAKHLLDQGKTSMLGDMCAYRGNGELSCAVGCLIPDDAYESSMEGKTVYTLIHGYPEIKELFGEHLHLLQELQHCHDKWHASDWEDNLEKILTKVLDEQA